MKYLITLDVGTTAIKTCLWSGKFDLINYTSSEYSLQTPQKDVVELPANTYWETAKRGIKRVVQKSKIGINDIKSITITTQGETLIPVDKNGKPLRKAIVWLDQRAQEESAIINKKIEKKGFYAVTGIPDITPICPICKVMWIKKHEPRIFQSTHKFLLLEDYLIFKLTGQFVTEQSLLSSTGYFDINRNEYWKGILSVVGISEQLFPAIKRCGEKVGIITPAAAVELGLSPDIIITTGAMDQISGAIGAGNIKPGIVSETTGTALVIAATIRKPKYSAKYPVTIYKHFDDKYLILPYCPTAGMVLKWFKDSFCQAETAISKKKKCDVYDMLTEKASGISPLSDGVVMIPYFAGKLNPDYNSQAKGAFFGIALSTGKAHLIRAILESIGYMLRENVEFIEKMGVKVSEIRSMGGGSRSRLWGEIKADICGKNIAVMAQEESASLGAAMLGAVGIGLYKNMGDVCAKFSREKRNIQPHTKHERIYEKGYRKYLDLYQSIKDLP